MGTNPLPHRSSRGISVADVHTVNSPKENVMLDLFSLFVVPAMQAAVGWGTKRVLDATFNCCYCDERNRSTRINNIDKNGFYCPNCHKTSEQFVNVCKFTVASTGEVGQIGLDLSSRYSYERDLLLTRTAIYVPGTFLFVGLQGKPVVETNTLSNFHSGKSLGKPNDYVWNVSSNRETRAMKMKVYLADVPPSEFYGKTLCLDTHVRSRYGDLLFTERDTLIPKPF